MSQRKELSWGLVSPLYLEVFTLRQCYRGNMQASVLVEKGRESGI